MVLRISNHWVRFLVSVKKAAVQNDPVLLVVSHQPQPTITAFLLRIFPSVGKGLEKIGHKKLLKTNKWENI